MPDAHGSRDHARDPARVGADERVPPGKPIGKPL